MFVDFFFFFFFPNFLSLFISFYTLDRDCSLIITYLHLDLKQDSLNEKKITRINQSFFINLQYLFFFSGFGFFWNWENTIT